ncbi:MAG: twin-arginine translocase TatA/TatE family subunit [Hydrogenobacter sp.]|uniref:twin-arginine translocase TatA/TatE family subunit n=1 Tax=Hydrogenobacter thermophilus TaxID=940 RepID=UPI0030FA0841
MHLPLPWQLILILLVVFVIFGASRLPELGKGLGEGIRNFKKALSGEETQKNVSEKEGG